jgi:magnesium-transporting ATPase (P-type)
VKLLLFDNGLQPSLNIYSEVISFLFVIFILAEKKSRTNAEAIEHAPEENEDQRRFRVRRSGNEHSCQAEQLLQGDILEVKEGDFLRFDAILLEVVRDEGEGLVVNEEEVGTGRSKCGKCSVWKVEEADELESTRDPFLLAGSKVLAGSGWAVVCVGARGRRGPET